MSVLGGLLGMILVVVAAVLLIVFVLVPLMKGGVYVVGGIFKGIGFMVMHMLRFVGGMFTDVVRSVGAVIASVILVPLVLVNIVIGRWSAASHFGRSLQDEIGVCGRCLYRVVIGHPAKFLFLNGLTEGIEQRVPAAIAKAPGSDKPSKKTGTFEGYKIVGSLKGGGSGGKLYVADPSQEKLAAFSRMGREDIDQVVIKSFSIREGSSMPQIVRESRALEAARKIGLVLEHEMTDERFFYVMPFVPGDDLTSVTQRLHAGCTPDGLDDMHLREVVRYVVDLLDTLDVYHRGELWHKDIKPDNIIIAGGEAHLVDLGLITPLRSAMTLTTHGTEYFRDPELVRMALRGVKVHEVDGVKFDLYGVGAVLFSVIENSFPAHGGLTRITKRCPETLRWIVRRSMTDMDSRYNSAGEMRGDLVAVLDAQSPSALKLKDLPSMQDKPQVVAEAVEQMEPEAESFGTPMPMPTPAAAVAGAAAVHATPAPIAPPVGAVAMKRARPRIGRVDWWTGKYDSGPEAQSAGGVGGGVGAGHGATGGGRVMNAAHTPTPRVRPVGDRRSASEQLSAARKRVQSAQKRAGARRGDRKARRHAMSRKRHEPNTGVIGAVVVFLVVGAAIVGAGALLFEHEREQDRKRARISSLVSIEGVPGIAGTIDSLDELRGMFFSATGAVFDGESEVFTSQSADQRERMIAVSNKDKVMASISAARQSQGMPGFEAVLAPEPSAPATIPEPEVQIIYLPISLNPDVVEEFEQIVSELPARGIGIIRSEQGEAVKDIIAKAKLIVGTTTTDDSDAQRRLSDWVQRMGEELGVDGVWWVDADGGHVLVTREGSWLGERVSKAVSER